MITRLYERLTGHAWTTTRSAAAEFGPPPAAVYAEQLAGYSDLDLIRHGPEILTALRQGTDPPTAGLPPVAHTGATRPARQPVGG